MPNSTKQVWNGVLGELEVTLSKANYRTWLKNTNLVSIDDSVAVVSVPNIFARDWIEQKYHDQIFTALTKLIDGLERVEYQIGLAPQASDSNEEKMVLDTNESKSTNASGSTQTHLPRGRQLSESYTFDSFVVGDSNRLAF